MLMFTRRGKYVVKKLPAGSVVGSATTLLDAADVAMEAARSGPGKWVIEQPVIEVDVSKAYGVLVAVTVVPSTPTGLFVATVSTDAATVECDAVDGATMYQWYLDGAPYLTTVETFVAFSGLVVDHQYSAAVAALNSAGSSLVTAAVGFRTTVSLAPSWVNVPAQSLVLGAAYSLDLRNYAADQDTASASLVFSVVAGAFPAGLMLTGSLISGAATSAGESSVTFRVSDGISAADQVVAFTVLAADTTAPDVPTGFAAVGYSATQVKLSWTNPAGDVVVAGSVTSGLSHTGVYRDGSFVAQVMNADAVNNEYIAQATATAQWKIRSADLAGNRSAFTVEVAAGPLLAVLDPPESVAAVRNSATTATLIWSAPSSGVAPTSYRVEQAGGATGPWSSVFTGLAFTFQQTTLTSAVTPFYRVFALNGAVESAASAVVSAPFGVVSTTVHFDDWANSFMYMQPPSTGAVVPASYFTTDAALQRWNSSSDVNSDVDAPIHIVATPGTPATPARFAKMQLTLDRGGNPNLRIERNEIVQRSFAVGAQQYSANNLVGHEYWLGRQIWIPPTWIGTDVYEIFMQGKASGAGLGVYPGISAGPYITIGPDYGFKASEPRDPQNPSMPARTSWAWRLRVSGWRSTTTTMPDGSSPAKATEVNGNNDSSLRLVNWLGMWVKFVIRVIPGWQDTGALFQLWMNGALKISLVNHTNTAPNQSGYGHAWKQGLYSGWAALDGSGTPTYVAGPGRPTQRIYYMRNWKMVEVTGRTGALAAVTSSDPGYAAVNPPDV